MASMSRREKLDQVVNDVSDKMSELRNLLEQTLNDVKAVSRLANEQQPTNSPQVALGGATESFSNRSGFSGLPGTGATPSLDGVKEIISETGSHKDKLGALCNEGFRRLSEVAYGDKDQLAKPTSETLKADT